MSNHIGISKVTLGTQLLLHRGEERQVDIQFLVTRAIERSHLCGALSASCLDTTSIEHHLRNLILCPILLEDLRPYILRSSKNLGGERRQLLFLLRKLGLSLCDLRIATEGILLHLLHHGSHRVATREPCKECHHNNTTDTQTSFRSATHSTAVFHVRAFSSSV